MATLFCIAVLQVLHLVQFPANAQRSAVYSQNRPVVQNTATQGGYGGTGGGGYSAGGGGGGYRGGGGGGFGNLLNGLDFNLLDLKAIALGFVRPQLVDTLCTRATNQLLQEGNKRVQSEIGNLRNTLTTTVENRCKQLVTEGESACDRVIGEILTRSNSFTAEALKEVGKLCDQAKMTTTEQVMNGANETFQMVLEESRKRANETYFRTVAEGTLEAEQKFAKLLEEGRSTAEQMLKEGFLEGRKKAEDIFNQTVKEEEIKGEAEFQRRLDAGKEEAELRFQETVNKMKEEGDIFFNEMVAKGRAKGEAEFNEKVKEGKARGEKDCIDNTKIACKNPQKKTTSDDFCEDFKFFVADKMADKMADKCKG